MRQKIDNWEGIW